MNWLYFGRDSPKVKGQWTWSKYAIFTSLTQHLKNRWQRCQLVRFCRILYVFLKENTAVRFFPPKYFFFFFFFILESESSTLHTLFMLWKTWFLNDNVKKRLRLHQRAPKTRVFPDPGRKDFVLRARDARSARKNTFFHLKYAFLSSIILFF